MPSQAPSTSPTGNLQNQFVDATIESPKIIQLSARGINLASLADAAIIAVPAYIKKYKINGVYVTNASATPILAQLSIYTAASAGGTNIVAAAVLTGLTSAAVIQTSTLAGTIAATMLTAASLYLRCSVANAGALTADVYIDIEDMT